MAPPQQLCSTHPKAHAGWHCGACDRYACPECVARKELPTSSLLICVHCTELVEPLRVLRSEARPFTSRIWGAFNFPLTRAGLFTMAVLGTVMFIAEGLWGGPSIGLRWGGLVYAFAVGLMWAYVFTIARKSAFGSEELEAPDFSDPEADLLQPARRGVFALLIMTLPASLFALGNLAPTHDSRLMRELADGTRVELTAEQDADPEVDSLGALTVGEDGEPVPVEAAEPEGRVVVEPEGPPRFLVSPLFWVLLLLGALVTPMALVIAISGGSYLDIINPLRHFAAIVQVPKDYAILTAGLGLLLVQYGLDEFTEELDLGIPILPSLLASILGMYVPLVLARMLGLFIYVHGAQLGYLPESELYETLVDEAPKGVAPDQAPLASIAGSASDGSTALAGLAGAAAAWAPPQHRVEGLEEGPTPDAPAYTRPRTITLDDEPMGEAPQLHRDVHDALPFTGGAMREVELSPDEPLQQAEPNPSVASRTGAFSDPASYDARAFDFLEEPGPPPELAPEAPLLTAIAKGDYAEALKHYRSAGPELLQQVSADSLFELGRQAATEADYPTAVKALKAAAQVDPKAPVSAKALVVLGRVLGERMGDASGAQRVFQHIVRVYPGTPAAQFAAGKLPT